MRLWWAENEAALMSWEWNNDELRSWDVYTPLGVALRCLYTSRCDAKMFIHLSVWCWDVYTPLGVALRCLYTSRYGVEMFIHLSVWWSWMEVSWWAKSTLSWSHFSVGRNDREWRSHYKPRVLEARATFQVSSRDVWRCPSILCKNQIKKILQKLLKEQMCYYENNNK